MTKREYQKSYIKSQHESNHKKTSEHAHNIIIYNNTMRHNSIHHIYKDTVYTITIII